ncbi:MAG: aminotransferase class IV [bacterium]
MFININGKFYKEKDAKISVLDRGFLYGDGVFETMRVYKGRIFTLEKHLDRFKNSCGKILLRIPKSMKEIEAGLYKTLKENKLEDKDAVLRMSITRGTGPFGLSIEGCSNPVIVIGARAFYPYPEKFYTKGVKVNILKRFRVYSSSILGGIKSNNYLLNVLARNEAPESGSFETVLVNEKGHVTEGTVSNIFLVKNGVLITPPVSVGILPGITRGIVLELAGKMNIEIREKLFKPDFIYSADEMFLTNISIEILPVGKVNGKIINSGKPGEMTVELIYKFRDLVRG